MTSFQGIAPKPSAFITSMATLQTLLESVILSMSADNPGTALIQKNKPSQISKTMLFSDSAKTTRGDVSVFSLKPTISQMPKPSQTAHTHDGPYKNKNNYLIIPIRKTFLHEGLLQKVAVAIPMYTPYHSYYQQ